MKVLNSRSFQIADVTNPSLSHLLIYSFLQLSFVFFYACNLFCCMMELALNIWFHSSLDNKWPFETAEWERMCHISWDKESPWQLSHTTTLQSFCFKLNTFGDRWFVTFHSGSLHTASRSIKDIRVLGEKFMMVNSKKLFGQIS